MDQYSVVLPSLPIDKRVIARATKMFRRGASVNDLIIFLHANSIDIVDTMGIIARVTGIKGRDAKYLVARHPLWSDVLIPAAELHDDAMSVIEEDPQATVSSNGTIRIDLF